jgi:hypothetical protein
LSTGLSTFDVGNCGCGCTTGVCAQLTNYAPATGSRPCGICADAGSAILTVKKSGAILYSGTMTFGGGAAPEFVSGPIFLTDHFIDATGADLGTQSDVFTFWALGPAAGGAAVTSDDLDPDTTYNVGDDGTWHQIHGIDPYTCNASGFHAHWVIPPDPGGFVDPGFAGYLGRYLGATDLYLDIAPYPNACKFPVRAQGCQLGSYPGVPGASFSIYDHAGGTLLYSGTTDASGNALADLPGNGSYYYTVSAPRWFGYSGTTTFSIGSVTSLPLYLGQFDTSLYACNGCPSPISQTLHATFVGTGPFVMLWNGSGQWLATVIVAGHTYQFQLDQNAGFSIARDGVNCVISTTGTCPPAYQLNVTVSADATCFPEIGNGTITE